MSQRIDIEITGDGEHFGKIGFVHGYVAIPGTGLFSDRSFVFAIVVIVKEQIFITVPLSRLKYNP